MIILSIDTSQSASVALVDTDTDTVLASEQADDQRRHVEFIGPALARVLQHEVRPELVVVGIGPGPFTGLRVGIAAGIAVGQARGIPVRGLLSQAALAEELRRGGPGSSLTGAESDVVGAETDGAGRVLIAADARRKEVYFSVYERTDASLIAGPFVAKPADVSAVLTEHELSDGTGTAGTGSNDLGSHSQAIDDRIGRGFVLYPDVLGTATTPGIVDPRAEFLAFAAARELAVGRELAEPIPEYLRDPDAKATPVRVSPLR